MYFDIRLLEIQTEAELIAEKQEFLNSVKKRNKLNYWLF